MTVCDLAVVTALPEELAPVAAGAGLHDVPSRGVAAIGVLQRGTTAAVLWTGAGTIAAARGIDTLLAQVAPRWILCGGIAGSANQTVAVGEAVIASSVMFYDRDVTALGVPLGSVHPGTPAELVPTAHVTLADTLADTPAWHRSPIATGDTFLTAEVLRQMPPHWQKRIRSAGAVDMESAAWALVAEERGVPWAVVRVVSDTTEPGDPPGGATSFRHFCRAAGNVLLNVALS